MISYTLEQSEQPTGATTLAPPLPCAVHDRMPERPRWKFAKRRLATRRTD